MCGTTLNANAGPPSARRGGGREQRDLDPVERPVADRLDRERPATERQGAGAGLLAREQARGVDREAAGLEELEQGAPHQTGGAQDGDVVAHGSRLGWRL